MPIFEYRCASCGVEFEELQFSAADRPERCRACGSARLERLLSAFAVHSEAATSEPEPGPCGACGAPERGMCNAERGEW
jgi:putative FmdB family regulatory protein